MRVTMVLGNTWHWSGGLPQLVSWAAAAHSAPSQYSAHKSEGSQRHGHPRYPKDIPYPISWNISAPPQREEGFLGWGNWTKLGPRVRPYGEFMSYVASFFTNQKVGFLVLHSSCSRSPRLLD